MKSRISASVDRLVSELESSGALRSDAVRRAFRRVERHRFVTRWYRCSIDGHRVAWSPESIDPQAPDAESLRSIYSDLPLVTRVDGASPISSSTSPRLMASMLEALDLRPGMRVLEIGTGTGYNAALLAEILGDARSVYTVDLRDDVVDDARASLREEGYGDVRVASRDGYWGFEEGAPFDRIVATVGCADTSPHWFEQLAADGRLLIPLQHGILHPLVSIVRGSGTTCGVGRVVGSSSFMTSGGALRWVNPWQSYRIAGLRMQSTWNRPTPAGLPASGLPEDALGDATHQDFHFFLSLCSRELWYSGSGYGLADPGAGAAVVICAGGVRGFARPESGGALDLLYARLLAIADAWRNLGRPRAGDYELLFTSKANEPALGEDGRGEWVIERVTSWEVARLPHACVA